ncbi:MAG: hypothetical protein N2235_00590 [Fischerella sp.]|nr:hypothetical protein [Fischerella sp.]
MSAANSPSSRNSGLNLVLFTIPLSFLLQMGTVFVLILLLAEKVAVETLQAVGEASEELFRGVRLPILDFPEPDAENKR